MRTREKLVFEHFPQSAGSAVSIFFVLQLHVLILKLLFSSVDKCKFTPLPTKILADFQMLNMKNINKRHDQEKE